MKLILKGWRVHYVRGAGITRGEVQFITDRSVWGQTEAYQWQAVEVKFYFRIWLSLKD